MAARIGRLLNTQSMARAVSKLLKDPDNYQKLDPMA